MKQRTRRDAAVRFARLGRDPAVTMPAFQAGGEFTVGAEEEYMLVHDDGRLLSNPPAGIIERLRQVAPLSGGVSPEVFACQVEFATVVCRDAESIGRCLAGLRQRLPGAGLAAMAVGVHPTARFGNVRCTRSERYDPIVAEFAGLYRTPTAAFQVHVGLPDAVTAIAAYRGLRNRLPLLRALAAASPYWHGRDSGLASARSALIRSYPRHGVPPLVRSYDQFAAVACAVMAAAEVPDYTHLWWGLRPHPRLGTVEVRVMDAQPSIGRAVALAALIQGLARHAVERPASLDLPGEVLAESDFRALRYGLDARLVDVDGTLRPARELAETALRHAREALGVRGAQPLDILAAGLSEPPECSRQRKLVRNHGMRALLEDLMATTVRCS
jgi:carboxylate-amine ligase